MNKVVYYVVTEDNKPIGKTTKRWLALKVAEEKHGYLIPVVRDDGIRLVRG